MLLGVAAFNNPQASTPATAIVFVSGGTYYAVDNSGNQIASSTTDAGTVINTAIAQNGRVLIKKGTYTCTTAIVFTTAGQSIEGEGMGVTTLSFDGSVLATLVKMTDTTTRAFLGVSNLTISSSVTGSGIGINADYFTVSRIENVQIDAVNKGIDISNGSAFYNFIKDVRITCSAANGFGIRLAKNENTVLRTRISFNDSNNATGIIINAHGCHLISPDIESGANVGAIGIDIQASGHNTTIDDVYLEANNINLQLASGVKSFVCMGGVIIDAKTSVVSNIVDNGAIYPLIKVRLGNTAAPADNLGYQDYSSFLPFPSSRFQTSKGKGTTYKLHSAYYGVAAVLEGTPNSVTATGTATAAEDSTEGRYTQYATGAAANTPAGHRYTAGLSTGRQNIRFRGRFALPVNALGDYRVYIGLTSDLAAFPTTNDPIGTTRSAMLVVKRATDTNWFIGHNDASGAAVYDDSGIAIAAIGTYYTVDIRSDNANSRYLVSIDNNAFTIVSTDIPVNTTLLSAWIAIESVNATDAQIRIPYYELEADR